MYTETSDRPGLDEQYISATNTSDLTLREGACAADHLIAAGLMGNRMGMALIHLRAEWDAADKPRKPIEAEINFRAELLQSVLGRGDNGKPDIRRARIEALIGYERALRARAEKLRGRAAVLGLLREWALLRHVDADLLSPALYHWLNPGCPVCDGHGMRKIEGAPALSTKQCHHCAGTGSWPRPLGAERVSDYLKSCVGKARRDRKYLLRGNG